MKEERKDQTSIIGGRENDHIIEELEGYFRLRALTSISLLPRWARF